MRNLVLILSVLLNAGLLAFILFNGDGEKAPEGGADSGARHTSEPTADESWAKDGQSKAAAETTVTESDRSEPADERAGHDEEVVEAAPVDPVAESEKESPQEWHEQASRDIRELVHERLGDDAYLMEFGCEGSDCQGQVYFSGAESITRVESMLDTLNESDGSFGANAGRPALLESIQGDPNGLSANFVIREGAELSEPEPEEIMDAARRYQKEHGSLPGPEDDGQ